MTEQVFAMVFPGQGSQTPGMLGELAEQHAVVEQTFAEASDVLGYDLWALCVNGPQEEMNLTEKTQPLLLTSSVAMWRILQSTGLSKPALLAGHSLGEFSALVCSGVLAFGDAVDLVRRRGQFMQTAVPVGVGAMAAIIGLDDDKVVELCAEHSGDEVVEAVNFNSPGQIVIAEHAGAVDNAIAACKEAGAKRAMPLPVSAPFHTSLMRPAGDQLAEAMSGLEFSAPQIPIVHNVTAETEADPEVIRELMFQQIFSPVRWSDCVAHIVTQNVTAVFECGPGKVLSGLCKRCNKSLKAMPLDTPDALASALT